MSGLEFPVEFENPAYGVVGAILGSVALVLFYLSYKRLRIAQKKLELVEWRRLRGLIRIVNFGTKAGVVIALSFLLASPYLQTTIEVPIDEATKEQTAQYTITAMVLMDVSYSMNNSDLRPTRLEMAKRMAKLLISKMDAKDLVGLISFAGQVYDVVFPTTNRTRIAQAIDNQTLHQSTAIGTAVETAIGVLEASSGGKAIVLYSDGKSNTGINASSATDQAVSLRTPVFTVSMGTYGLGEADPLALREISEKTGGKFYEARNEDIENLATSVSEISHEVKIAALQAVYSKLTIAIKDYQTPSVYFSALLVAALFLMWFTGV
jgi:Ca-activated chloride channel family protein